ncbi:MAG: polysaccharide export outer membrane protein [Phormidesmis priestleyi Ana]|uniref:Polysaccharide export outer membrane protein n=1 Tax=Phormidesmis priestleyi Ana TaxID=1666911 RepID=A0A0P7YW03_9CYAN|nr:MAG: polysaccharide export outer membrane protein [Phormidesmis priestleyi Ana]
MVKMRLKWRQTWAVGLGVALAGMSSSGYLAAGAQSTEAIGNLPALSPPTIPVALSPPTAAISASSGTGGALSDAYALGPGDMINISIFNVPEYSGPQQVSADGSLNLPVVGGVSVNGLTLQAAGSAISRAYRSELRYPEVTVVLTTPRPLRVAISGEVSQPGLYTLTPEGNAQFPTVAQALQKAGGVTQAADLRSVQLRRLNGQGPAQAITLDLWQLLNNGDVRQDLPLRDGDAIVIGETLSVDVAETNRLSASNLASNVEQAITVAVVGEVFRPGAYEFDGNSQEQGRTTVTQVVQRAGGIKPSADLRNIQVRRLTRSGTEQIIDLDFWALLRSGDISQDLVLQQSDTVVIPVATEMTPQDSAELTAANFSPDEVMVNVVGEVERPGMLQVSPNTTLNQAVLAAGGFTQRATETVELIRLNPNGSVTQREVKVNLETGLDAEANPLILNNDVVVVGRNGRARFSDSVGAVLNPLLQLTAPFNLLFRMF